MWGLKKNDDFVFKNRLCNFFIEMTLRRDFFLHHLTPTEFEHLVITICEHWLGTGASGFADGKDGGRDASFSGKADEYPSKAGAWNGQIVVQAKHTATPNASCSDSNFKKYYLENEKGNLSKDTEITKIENLISENLLDYYLVFSNRKLTSGAEKSIKQRILKCGMKDVAIIGLEKIHKFLQENPTIAKTLPTIDFGVPFDFSSDEMVDVIQALGETLSNEDTKFDSKIDFSIVNKKKIKNKANNMSDSYYSQVIVSENMPLFERVALFLKNDRNAEYRDIYHDIADELRQKIILNREAFDTFEEVIVFLYDQIKDAQPSLRGNRRYVTLLLSYMYFDCDIGEREPVA